MIEKVIKDAEFAAEVFREVFPCKHEGVLDCPLCSMPGMQTVKDYNGNVRFFCPYCMTKLPKGHRSENLYFLLKRVQESESQGPINMAEVYKTIDVLAVDILERRSDIV